MKNILKIATVLTLIMGLKLPVRAQNQVFSGNYLVNKTKTEFGQAPEYTVARAYWVTQSGTDLTIIRTVLDPQMQEHQDTLLLKANGATFQNYSYSHKKQSFTLK